MLTNKKREFLYALTVFGPHLVFSMIVAYFLSAVNPVLFEVGAELWAWTDSPIVVPVVFGVLFTLGRVFDALIDIPLAAKIDKIKDKYKRLRTPLVIAFAPLVASAIAICFPLVLTENSVLNTIWFTVAMLIFFTTYTLTLIAFYSGLSGICKDRKQRQRVSYFKSFIDTVLFALVYAITPLILSALGGTGMTIFGRSLNVMHIVLMATPLMLTVFIPVLMSRGHKDESPDEEDEQSTEAAPEKVTAIASIKHVISNRAFWPWVLVAFVYFVALQLFLSTQNELISGVLLLTPAYAAMLNAAVFGPVPIMLFIFHKVVKKKGLRFALQVGLLSFAVGIACFSIGSAVTFPGELPPPELRNPDTMREAVQSAVMPRIMINATGATISGFSVGAFFMMLMMIPSQVAAVEIKVKKRRNSAMYFAGQGIALGIGGAIATGLIADVILRTGLEGMYAIEGALGMPDAYNNVLYNVPLGGFISPFITAGLCIVAFCLTFFMPKSYDALTIGKLIDKNYVPDAEDLADAEIEIR